MGIKIGCKGSEGTDRCKSRGGEPRCSRGGNNQLWERWCDWKNLPLGHSATGTDLLLGALRGKKTFTSVSKLWHEHKGREKYSSRLFSGHYGGCLLPFGHKNLWGMDGFLIFVHSFPCNCCSSVTLAVIQHTHHTSSPRLTGWFSSGRREGRWRGPPGSSARCRGSTRPRRPRPGSCPRCPRPAHLLGYRWRSTRWTQWWRLPLGPTPSPNITGSLEDLWKKGGSCLIVDFN